MAYSQEDKDKLFEILETKDFDIKNSVIKFNKITTHRLERGTVYDWINNDEFFKKKYDLRKQELLDESENMHRLLRIGIPIKDEETGQTIAWQERPDRAAIEFFLKAKGKERGYSERLEIDQTNKTELKITVQDQKTKEELNKLINGDD